MVLALRFRWLRSSAGLCGHVTEDVGLGIVGQSNKRHRYSENVEEAHCQLQYFLLNLYDFNATDKIGKVEISSAITSREIFTKHVAQPFRLTRVGEGQ